MIIISFQLPVHMFSLDFSLVIAELSTLEFQMIQIPMSFISGLIHPAFLKRKVFVY